MKLKKKNKSNMRGIKIKFPTKRAYYINPIKWFLLIFLGKRDANRGAYNGTDIPFVEYERSKANKYAAKLIHILQIRTLKLNLIFDTELTVLEQKSHTVTTLMKRLEESALPEEIIIIEHDGLPSKVSSLLNAKRESEKDLEDKAIRIRRFNEYQKKLLPLRNELSSEMQKLMISYQVLISSAVNLDNVYEQVNALIRKYVSFINMQISLYRRGWFIMKNKKGLSGAVPTELNYEDFIINYEPRIEDIQKSVANIIDKYKNILNKFI